ncbi:unnamed protein product [Chrysodeixis includens]|uniref:Uncharacterized protein n=1 Tax=Chrysodeixis includens TaxID=689277 RepID=A0A9N8Q1M3_CHRIL|nr:unnamed protein product [Chrysodeixis includens]
MIHKWWHRFVRKRTKPIAEDTALFWKRRLSIAYGLIAWNAFGLVLYSAYKGKADWAYYHGLKSEEEHNKSPGLAWANTLGIKNAKVYKISGLTKVDEYDIVDGESVKQDKSIKQLDSESLNENQ